MRILNAWLDILVCDRYSCTRLYSAVRWSLLAMSSIYFIQCERYVTCYLWGIILVLILWLILIGHLEICKMSDIFKLCIVMAPCYLAFWFNIHYNDLILEKCAYVLNIEFWPSFLKSVGSLPIDVNHIFPLVDLSGVDDPNNVVTTMTLHLIVTITSHWCMLSEPSELQHYLLEYLNRNTLLFRLIAE